MIRKQPRIAALGGTRGISLGGAWQQNGLAELVAVCDINPQTAQDRLETLNPQPRKLPKIFSEANQMLSWGEFDAVIVATPDATHHSLARQVLSQGFHCFIEKPMTTTVEDAVDLIKVWRASHKTAVVGHEFRHAAIISQAREKILDGTIGTPRLAITIDSCGRMGSYWRRENWRADTRHRENSLTLQKAIHQLDIQSFLMASRPRRVFSSAGQDHFGGDQPKNQRCADCPEAKTCLYHTSRMKINCIPQTKAAKEGLCVYGRDLDLHDNQTVVIDYANGARGSYVECFFTPDYKVEHTIIGDLGRICIRYFPSNPLPELEISWIGDRHSEKWLCPAKGSHCGGDYILSQVFIRALREKRQAQPDLVEGYWAIAMAKAIDQSAATGEPVILPEKIPGLETI